MIRRRGAQLAAVGALTLGACSSSGSAQGTACGPPQRLQAQFPAGHVLPGAPEPSYLSDPPTSGPHAPLTEVPAEVTEPLEPPEQVGVLERGLVLVQYRPRDVGSEGQADLASLDEHPAVVVAPQPDLPDPVAASAWLHLMTCGDVDVDALETFVEEHRDRAPGGHDNTEGAGEGTGGDDGDAGATG